MDFGRKQLFVFGRFKTFSLCLSKYQDQKNKYTARITKVYLVLDD